jgi:hypothetical protein
MKEYINIILFGDLRWDIMLCDWFCSVTDFGVTLYLKSIALLPPSPPVFVYIMRAVKKVTAGNQKTHMNQ